MRVLRLRSLRRPPLRMTPVATIGFGGEAGAKLAVGGYSAGDEDAPDAKRFSRSEGLLHQVAYDRVLKTGNEIERGLRAESESFFAGLRRTEVGHHTIDACLCFCAKCMQLDVAEDSGLDS